MNPHPGTVIVLNGTSSAGKSTLLRALQAECADPFLDAGLDRFLWMLPQRYLRPPLWNEVLGHADRAGELGHRLVRGMHATWAALSGAGSNIVADHVLVEPAWLEDCAERLAGLPTLFVGLVCPLDVLEDRERLRTDRTLGQARAQFDRVHRQARYDIVVDTAELSAEQAARQIALHLATEGPNFAFNTGHCAGITRDSPCH